MMNLKKTLLTLVFVVVSLNIFGPLVQTVSAVDIENPETRMASLTERWVRYRALYFCFNNGKTLINLPFSYDEVQSADFMEGNTVGIGYLNEEDGKVSCDDGAFVNNSASKIGWDGVEEMVCSMEKVSCSDGKFKFDTGSTSSTAKIFKTAKGKIADDTDFPFDPKGEMWYYLYKRNLEVFCGDNKPLTSESSSTSYKSKKAVSAYYVDPKTGVVTRVDYELNRDDTDTINDLYAGEGDGTIDHSCSEIAEKTKNHSSAYASYIRKYYIDSVAQSFKAEVVFSDELRQKKCGDPPAGDNEVAKRVYASCISSKLVSVFNNAVNTCAAKVPPETMPEAIASSIKECLKTELPSEFDEAINNLRNPTFSEAASAATSDASTSCAVEGIGWIVCPVINFMADLNDKALEFLGDQFLSISPDFFENGSASGTAWKSFRDIANVAFVVVFLLIIYSQITGGGFTNYGIKKLLPKIIIVAVLVNTSFFLCQIAIDLSNIVGNSVAALMNTIPTTSADQATQAVGWKDVSGKVLAATGGIVIALVLLSVIGPAALLALAIVVLILIARKALIILLVVISPLAFVAYLLPNTEQYFKKWWKIFSTLLLIYPIIGLIFGASQLAAKAIVASAPGDPLIQLTALGVMAIPLFAIPFVLKGVTSSMGTIGAKLSGMQDRATNAAGKGAKDKLKRRAENIEARAANSGNRYARFAGGFRNRRAFRRKSMEEATSRNQEEGLLQHITAHPNSYNDQQRAAAAATLDKRYSEEVKAAGSSLQSRLGHAEILAAAEHGQHNGVALSEHERDAAIQYTMERGNFEERHAVATSAGSMTRSQRKSVGSGLRAKGDIDVYGNAAIAALEQTDRPDEAGPTGMDTAAAAAALQAGVVSKINNGELSVDTVTKDHRVAGYVAGAATAANAPAVDALRDEVADFQISNPQAWAKLSPETKTRTSSI